MTDDFADLDHALNSVHLREWARDSAHQDAAENTALMRDMLAHRVTLDISDLLTALGDDAISDVVLGEIDEAVPPWECTLVEWLASSFGPSKAALDRRLVSHPNRLGCLFFTLRRDRMARLLLGMDEDDHLSDDDIADTLRDLHPAIKHGPPHLVDVTEWLINQYTFIRTPQGICGPFTETTILLDHNGNTIDLNAHDREDVARVDRNAAVWLDWCFTANGTAWGRNDLTEGAFREMMESINLMFMMPSLIALQYANFQNIRPREMAAEYESRQVQRAEQRQGKPPRQRYHILEIGPAGVKDPRRYQPLASVLREMPLHGVRRHRRSYGPKYGRGLLFGKYEGRFWIPPHVRGNPERGVVHKDYTETKRTLDGVTQSAVTGVTHAIPHGG